MFFLLLWCFLRGIQCINLNLIYFFKCSLSCHWIIYSGVMQLYEVVHFGERFKARPQFVGSLSLAQIWFGLRSTKREYCQVVFFFLLFFLIKVNSNITDLCPLLIQLTSAQMYIGLNKHLN